MKNNRLITITIPIVFFLFLLIADRPFPDFLPNLTRGELGLVESLQVIFLLATFVVASSILFQFKVLSNWIKIWILTGMMATLYVFLEETSYGQHYLRWDTPDYWQDINDQKETNFHNTSSWFDQKPRLLLELGIIVGGIIVPLLCRFKPIPFVTQEGLFKQILPDRSLFVIAILAVLPRTYERILTLIDVDNMYLFIRTSEVQELYFYFFILLYFIFLRKILLTG